MKTINKLILSFLFASITFAVSSQTNPLDGMIKKYAEEPGFYFLDMKTNMFGSESNDVNPQNKLISIKILSFEESSSTPFKAAEIYEKFNSTIDINTYKGLVEVKESGDKMDLMVKKDGNDISEIIIIIREKDEATFIAATGSFDLKDIVKFSEMKNCRGLETLQKLCED